MSSPQDPAYYEYIELSLLPTAEENSINLANSQYANTQKVQLTFRGKPGLAQIVEVLSQVMPDEYVVPDAVLDEIQEALSDFSAPTEATFVVDDQGNVDFGVQLELQYNGDTFFNRNHNGQLFANKDIDAIKLKIIEDGQVNRNVDFDPPLVSAQVEMFEGEQILEDGTQEALSVLGFDAGSLQVRQTFLLAKGPGQNPIEHNKLTLALEGVGEVEAVVVNEIRDVLGNVIGEAASEFQDAYTFGPEAVTKAAYDAWINLAGVEIFDRTSSLGVTRDAYINLVRELYMTKRNAGESLIDVQSLIAQVNSELSSDFNETQFRLDNDLPLLGTLQTTMVKVGFTTDGQAIYMHTPDYHYNYIDPLTGVGNDWTNIYDGETLIARVSADRLYYLHRDEDGLLSPADIMEQVFDGGYGTKILTVENSLGQAFDYFMRSLDSQFPGVNFEELRSLSGNEFLEEREVLSSEGLKQYLLSELDELNVSSLYSGNDTLSPPSAFKLGNLTAEKPTLIVDSAQLPISAIKPQDVLQDFPWENLDLDSLRIIDDAGELLEFQIEDNFEAIFTGASDEAVLSKAGELGFVNSAPVNTRDLSFGFVDADSDGAYVFGASPGSIGAIESLADGQRVVVAVSGDVLNLELSSSNQGFILIETALGKQVIYIEEMTGASFELELPGGNVITVQRDDLFDSSKEGSPIVRSDAYTQENSVADRVFVNTQDRIFFETPEFNDGPRDYVSIGAADWLNLPRDFVDGNLDNYQLAPIELFDSYSLGSGLDFTGLLDLGDNEYLSSRSAQSSLGKDYFWVRPTDRLALGSMQGLGDFSLSNLSGRADLTVRVADPALDVWTLFEQSSFVQDQSASIGSLSLQGLAGEDLGSLEFQLGDNIQLLQLRFGDDIALDPETFRVLQNDDGTFTTVMQEGAELTVSSGETVLAQDLIDHTKQEATNVADFLFQELSSVFSKLQDVIFGSEFEQLQGEILGRLLLGESLDEIVEAIGSELAENLVEELVAVPLLNTLNIDPQSFAHGVAKASVAGFAVNVLQGEENLGEAAGDAVVTAAVTRALAKVNYGLNEGASSGIGDSGNSGLGESGNAAIAAAVTTLVLSLSKGGLGSENLEHSYKAAVSAAASQYVAHLVAVSLTPLFGPLGYAVGYAVGQALGDVVGVPVYNYVGNKLDAGKEVYDAFEDLLTGKDGFGQFAKDFGKALDDLLINAPKEFIQDLGKGIIDKFLGGYSKQSSTNTVASRTEVTAGGNSRIIGVRAEGALLQASQSGDDEILGTNGADVIVGRDGANVAAGFGGDDLLEGRDGDDALLGGSGDDHIEAGSGGDYIEGGDGDDKIYGDAGDDGILGGSGRDIVSGGSGNDQIEGGTDVDILYGGTGEDLILGGQGSDLIDGGAGDDILLGETGNDKINGGEGSDQLDGGADSDSLFGGDGADVIRGGSGNDFLAGESGIDVIHGDLGDDILEGGEGSDFLTGGFGNDLLIGDAGNDALFGEFGDDTLIAGAGGDTLEGGSGDDVLISGTENDDVLGGSGDDYYVFAQGDDIDTIIDTAGVQDVIKLENYSLDHMVFEQAENGKDLIIFVDFGTERLILENQLTDPSIEILVDHTGRAVDLSTLSFDDNGNASFTEIFFDSSEQDRKLRENYQSSVSASSLTNLLSSWYVDNFDLNILESSVDEEIYNDVQVKSRREKRHKWGGHYEVHYDYHESNIHGSDAAERIVGLWWAENIYANGGDDQVYGQHGDDDLYGGDGTDLLIGGSENDFIDGGQGTDKAFGSAGNDKIFGNVGNDALFGEWGDDKIYGDAGDDKVLNLWPSYQDAVFLKAA